MRFRLFCVDERGLVGYIRVNTNIINDDAIYDKTDKEFRAWFDGALRYTRGDEGIAEPEFSWYFSYRVGDRRRRTRDRVSLWERFGGVCYLCRSEVGLEEFHAEHVVPLARGGEDGPANLNMAHPACSQRKGTKLLSELDWFVVA